MGAHPFLYPFKSKERWLSYLRNCLNWNEEELGKAESLLDKKIIPVLFGPEIANFMGVSTKLVSHMAIMPNKYYRSFKIKKKTGKFRTITAPRVFLKTIQRYILDCILTPLKPHKAATGFRRKLSMKKGASSHVGHPYIWNIDLKDFFPSIGKDTVIELFKKVGFSERASIFLAGLCCLEDSLPQGAPTSPALSNLIFQDNDRQISKTASRKKISYTRYADDLSFSANQPISKDFQKQINSVVEKAGFKINDKKSRLMGPRCRREVTGLTVNERVSIPRPTRRRIRALFHHALMKPEKFIKKKERLLGYANWISQYHPVEGQRYLKVAQGIASG
ncbi:MAG: retron St85 family RNA-directed DNA polymerase [Thermodesulfobacteriota bacterium]|jgi:retron-type reverse transcriptase